MYNYRFSVAFFIMFSIHFVSGQNNSNSGIDSSRFNGIVSAIVVQHDGKIIVGGNFSTYNKLPSRGIARLNPDGSLDKSFITGSGFNSEVQALVLQPDGKVIAGGKFSNYNGSANSCNRIVRLNIDGSIDNSFAISIGFSGDVMALALQRDGKVVVGGMLSKFNSIACDGLVRLNANGSLDKNFVYVKGISGYVYSICLLPGGKIMAGGYFGHFDRTVCYGIVRLNNDGSLDNSFVVNKGFYTGGVYALAVQSNGKVVAGGNFKSYNGIPCHYIIRLNIDGSMDNSFTPPGNPLKEYSGYGIFALAIQPDGKIIASGRFDYYNTTLRQSIVRLNTDGSQDDTFGGDTGFDTNGRGAATVSTLALNHDNNILAGGTYERYNGVLRKNITTLDKNGKLLQATFHAHTGFDKTMNALALQNVK